MNRKLVLTALCCLPLLASAEEAAEQSPFTSSAELGMLYKTGNTKSADIKTGFDIKYEQALWRSTFAFDLLIKKTEQENDLGKDIFETTDEKWTLESKTNYTLDPKSKNYIYGDVAYENNRFSSYENQSSISTGWGREWYKTEKSSLFADIGPGYKREVTKATDTVASETNSAFIIQAQAIYLRKINEHVEFKQKLSVKYAPESGENSKYKAESSITTKLIETLQLKFSFLVDHNTEVEQGQDNTDTQTAVTVVYSF
ncbi:MAG: putative salt-induced outer membrane protein [Alteromonadaceae bacterium]|jgi:putative salt-induced outer membrane protein